MGTVYGGTYTKYLAGGASNEVNPNLLRGNVRVLNDSYLIPITGSIGATTILCGYPLPTNAMVVGFQIQNPAMGGTAGTISLGDEGDTARYMAAIQATTAAIRIMSTTAAAGGIQYEITGVTDNIIRITTAGTLSAGTIKLTVFYVKD